MKNKLKNWWTKLYPPVTKEERTYTKIDISNEVFMENIENLFVEPVPSGSKILGFDFEFCINGIVRVTRYESTNNIYFEYIK